MKFNTLNGIRDIQVVLQEVGLYSSSIDGIWGGGCQRAARAFFDYCSKQRSVTGITEIPQFIDGDAVILGIQTNLKKLSLYPGTLDGIWGKGSFNGINAAKDDYIKGNNLPKYSACWSKKVPAEFIAKIVAWVKAKNMPIECVDYLMAIMAFESGGTFDPKKQNMAGAKYFGLIQFGAAAAKDLGTTIEALVKMTQLEQLDYVFKYFEMRMRVKPLTKLEDFYMAVFYPAAIGKSADTAIFLTGSIGYRQNIGLDVDKDGSITVGEINFKIYKSYYDGMLIQNRSLAK